jgi:hypothetical protein
VLATASTLPDVSDVEASKYVGYRDILPHLANKKRIYAIKLDIAIEKKGEIKFGSNWYTWYDWYKWTPREMNKTIYIRDEDAGIWNRARELSNDKLSPVIVAALKRFVAEREAKAKGFERIQVSYNDSDEHGIPKAKAFYGRWIFPPNEPLRLSEEFGDACNAYSVAVTAKGGAVVLYWGEDAEGRGDQTFRVYPSLENAATHNEVNYAVRRAIQEIGVPVEELDI